jgi:hypothetical protein
MHTIRLRDPWDAVLTPTGWHFSRRFQRPTGLAPEDTVHLELAGVTQAGLIRLNGNELGPLVVNEVLRWPIQDLLHFRNAILIELSYGEELAPEARKVPGELIGEVRLVIESAQG